MLCERVYLNVEFHTPRVGCMIILFAADGMQNCIIPSVTYRFSRFG